MRTLTSTILATALLAALAACGQGELQSDALSGADETATVADALTGSFAIGSTVQATADVNLRSGPSTNYRIIMVIPSGSKAKTVERTTPSGGFYKINYAGHVGWTSGTYLKFVAPPPPTARDLAIARAKSGVGFSYYWGHGSWDPAGATSSNKGNCVGSCPNCSHTGGYGADCSGFAAKVWQVPSTNTDITIDTHPYSTYNFRYNSYLWSPVVRSNLIKADALVYNADNRGHIVIFESGNGWGNMYTYEAKGCLPGIVRNLRVCDNGYIGIRLDKF